MLFCPQWIFFFKINFFKKYLSGIPSECQIIWIQIRPDILSGLIWIQTVCKGYQQTTKVATSWKELIVIYSLLRLKSVSINKTLILHENVCCGYSLAVPCRGTSNEYHMICFQAEIRKISIVFWVEKMPYRKLRYHTRLRNIRIIVVIILRLKIYLIQHTNLKCSFAKIIISLDQWWLTLIVDSVVVYSVDFAKLQKYNPYKILSREYCHFLFFRENKAGHFKWIFFSWNVKLIFSEKKKSEFRLLQLWSVLESLPPAGLIQLTTNWLNFSYFSWKTGFTILCKLETICMNLQNLFSGKKNPKTNRIWYFMQIGDNLHEISKPVFWEK